jgi:hypothetical protein
VRQGRHAGEGDVASDGCRMSKVWVGELTSQLSSADPSHVKDAVCEACAHLLLLRASPKPFGILRRLRFEVASSLRG